MAHRILIVDDDDDFRSLLADLYTQADYEVTPFANPLEALKQFKKDDYQLCVVDQTMPDLKGIDLIDQVRLINPRIPVIMISAFLGEDVIERLRQLRIDVFHKPLNVRSLLRKTAELINGMAAAGPTHAAEVMSEAGRRVATDEKDAFMSFPLKSEMSRKFHREILSMKQGPSNLVLVGPAGTHFHLICEDIESLYPSKDHLFLYLSNDKITSFEILRMLSGEESARNIMVVLLEAYDLQPVHRDVVLKLYRKSGPFSAIQNQVRFVFCLNEDLDTQYSKGKIDEDFYLILGQKEIFVPTLNECSDDIPEMALTIAKNYARDNRQFSFRGFDSSAIDFLKNYEWERNYAQLEATIHAAVRLAEGYPIGEDLLKQLASQPDFIVETPSIRPSKPAGAQEGTPAVPPARPAVAGPQSAASAPVRRPAVPGAGPAPARPSAVPPQQGMRPAASASAGNPAAPRPTPTADQAKRLHFPTAQEMGLPARKPQLNLRQPGTGLPVAKPQLNIRGAAAPAGDATPAPAAAQRPPAQAQVPVQRPAPAQGQTPAARPAQAQPVAKPAIKPGNVMSAPAQKPIVSPSERPQPNTEVMRFPKLVDETDQAQKILSRGKPF